MALAIDREAHQISSSITKVEIEHCDYRGAYFGIFPNIPREPFEVRTCPIEKHVGRGLFTKVNYLLTRSKANYPLADASSSNVTYRWEKRPPSNLAPTRVITHPGTSTVNTASKYNPINAREVSKTIHQPSPRRQNCGNLPSKPTVTLLECAALSLKGKTKHQRVKAIPSVA
jgi:hypothetical protein